MDDKQIERERYEERSRDVLASPASSSGSSALGSAGVTLVLRAPYLAFEQAVRRVVRPDHRALEIGAGTGAHTAVLLESGARVTPMDISRQSLVLLTRQLDVGGAGRLTPCVADMEALPYADASFDVVTSAGSLSYGDPALLDAELGRVLRPGGAFICVDSLNHNPIYRLNRWLRHKRGERSASTLRRMPDAERISRISDGFEEVELRFYGGFSWLMPVVARLTGQARAAALSDRLDRWLGVRHSAFKFVLVALGRR